MTPSSARILLLREMIGVLNPSTGPQTAVGLFVQSNLVLNGAKEKTDAHEVRGVVWGGSFQCCVVELQFAVLRGPGWVPSCWLDHKEEEKRLRIWMGNRSVLGTDA